MRRTETRKSISSASLKLGHKAAARHIVIGYHMSVPLHLRSCLACSLLCRCLSSLAKIKEEFSLVKEKLELMMSVRNVVRIRYSLKIHS